MTEQKHRVTGPVSEEAAIRARLSGARAPALGHDSVLAWQKVWGEILLLELSVPCKFCSGPPACVVL